jgi:hypothetical protein
LPKRFSGNVYYLWLFITDICAKGALKTNAIVVQASLQSGMEWDKCAESAFKTNAIAVQASLHSGLK